MTAKTLTPANDNRPPEFDARLLAYMPAINKLARRLQPEQPEDFAHDALVYLLGAWRNFRPDGGFYAWINLNMRAMSAQRHEFNARRNKIRVELTDEMTAVVGQAPRQEDYVAVGEAMAYAQQSREGQIVLRRAMGDSLVEIGADIGITRERVRQLEEVGHVKIRQTMGRQKIARFAQAHANVVARVAA